MANSSGPDGLRVFFSTTDHSGDQHAAALMAEIRRLRPEAEFAGLGGPHMADAGCCLLAETTLSSPMWFDTLREVGRMVRILRRTARFWRAWRPSVFVPIDSPGINFPLARKARKQGITSVYYIPPQIWAWGRWRLPKLKRLFRRLLVALPFEEGFYGRRGFNVEYVGHPLFDYLPRRELGGDVRTEIGSGPDAVLVGLLPGSRQQEVKRLMPILRDAASILRQRHPAVCFAVGAASPELVPTIEQTLQGCDLDAPVLLGRSLELMRDARLCLVASGTATLQLLHFATPMVIVYRLTLVEMWMMKVLKRSRHIGLVNVLAEHRAAREGAGQGTDDAPREPLPVPLAPELVAWRDRPDWVADKALALLGDSPTRSRTLAALEALRDEVDHPGAVHRAAEAIIRAADG